MSLLVSFPQRMVTSICVYNNLSNFAKKFGRIRLDTSRSRLFRPEIVKILCQIKIRDKGLTKNFFLSKRKCSDLLFNRH